LIQNWVVIPTFINTAKGGKITAINILANVIDRLHNRRVKEDKENSKQTVISVYALLQTGHAPAPSREILKAAVRIASSALNLKAGSVSKPIAFRFEIQVPLMN
jgi:hypothetical protein